MKQFNKVKLTHLFYALILLVAVFLRLVNLGTVPLTNNEAQHALCVLDAQRDDCENYSRLYIFFTDIFFKIFGTNNGSARMLPALLGSTIVLIPLLLSSVVERKTGILLAMCLALDPLLMQTSRSADDTMLGIVFVLFFLAFFLQRKVTAALITFAFGLLSGRSFWIGLVILGLATGVTWLLTHREMRAELNAKIGKVRLGGKESRYLFLTLFLFWIGISTRMFNDVGGLLSPLKSLLDIFPGAGTQGGTSAFSTDVRLIVFLFYSFYAISFSISALFHSNSDQKRRDIFLLVWILSGILIFLIPQFPFSQAAWVSIAMWVLAAGRMMQIGSSAWRERKPLILPVLVGLTILVFLSFQLLRLQYLLSAGLDLSLNLTLLITPMLLCLLFILLYAYGWSKPRAVQVLSILFIICGAVALLRNANRSSNLTGTHAYELVQEDSFFKNQDILIERIENYRNARGMPQGEVTIAICMDEPGERWEWVLRDYSVTVTDDISEETSNDYDMMIMRADSTQDFPRHESENLVLSGEVAWVRDDFSGFLPEEILEWLIYRTATLKTTSYAVWYKSL